MEHYRNDIDCTETLIKRLGKWRVVSAVGKDWDDVRLWTPAGASYSIMFYKHEDVTKWATDLFFIPTSISKFLDKNAAGLDNFASLLRLHHRYIATLNSEES